MSRSLCITALWFDDFFGDRRVASEREGSWGRLRVGGTWDDQDGTEPTAGLRSKLALPRMERKLHALIGRDEPDPLAEEEHGSIDPISDDFGTIDEEWLTGLEYEPIRGDRHDLDFGVGVRFSTPVDPYARLRYRFQESLGTHWLFRQQLSPFWRDSTRFGVASRIDVDHWARPSLLLRLSGAAAITELSEGVEWIAGPVLYQRLGESRAISYRLTSEGASDSSEPSTIHRLDTLLRQRIHREWLILEVGPRFEWRHPSAEEPRELVPGLRLALELRFGDTRAAPSEPPVR
jgi:hypothetical protein